LQHGCGDEEGKRRKKIRRLEEVRELMSPGKFYAASGSARSKAFYAWRTPPKWTLHLQEALFECSYTRLCPKSLDMASFEDENEFCDYVETVQEDLEPPPALMFTKFLQLPKGRLRHLRL